MQPAGSSLPLHDGVVVVDVVVLRVVVVVVRVLLVAVEVLVIVVVVAVIAGDDSPSASLPSSY